jgi:hypothetical protein
MRCLFRAAREMRINTDIHVEAISWALVPQECATIGTCKGAAARKCGSVTRVRAI